MQALPVVRQTCSSHSIPLPDLPTLSFPLLYPNPSLSPRHCLSIHTGFVLSAGSSMPFSVPASRHPPFLSMECMAITDETLPCACPCLSLHSAQCLQEFDKCLCNAHGKEVAKTAGTSEARVAAEIGENHNFNSQMLPSKASKKFKL